MDREEERRDDRAQTSTFIPMGETCLIESSEDPTTDNG